ncbi:metallophosphoesterase, partial [Streptomyces sp. 2MCAF27]
MVVLFALVALAVVGLLAGVHWYLWRRLVRDTTARGGRARRAGTVAAVVLPLISVGALVSGRAGAPFALQQALAWPGYLWLALVLYLTLALLAGEAVRPLLRRWLERRDAARSGQPEPEPEPDPEPEPQPEPELQPIASPADLPADSPTERTPVAVRTETATEPATTTTDAPPP